MNIGRRSFLKVVATGAALSFIPVASSSVTPKDILSGKVLTNREVYSLKVREILNIQEVSWEEMPYKVDWDKFEPFELHNTAFFVGPQMGIKNGLVLINPNVQGPAGRIFGNLDNIKNKRPGSTILDYALVNSAWLYQREGQTGYPYEFYKSAINALPDVWLDATKEFRAKVTPEELSAIVKRAAYYLGADIVRIAPVNGETRKLGIYKESQDKVPSNIKYVITFAFEMDPDAMNTGPAALEIAASGLAYSKQMILANQLAYFLELLGYDAIPDGSSFPDIGPTVFWAVRSGIGEQGRHSIVITPEYGPRVRVAKVWTSADLVPDKPIRFGVWEFCQTCKKCAEHCPSGAIPLEGGIGWEGPTICEEKGVYKYHINHLKCYEYWNQVGSDCGVCIRVCPYTKRRWWAHEVFRDYIAPVIGGELSKAIDDFLGYGEQLPPAEWWGEKSGYKKIFR